MRTAMLMALACWSLQARPRTFEWECNHRQVFRPAPSPDDLLDNRKLPTLWARLGISGKVRIETERGFQFGPDEISCARGCTATIDSTDRLLDADGSDAIVRVCLPWDAACRFLVLHKDQRGWGLVDYFDSDFEKYEAPKAEVVAAGERRWLVRSGFGGGGTGVLLRVQDWYEVRCGRVGRVLSHVLRGHELNVIPMRSFSTRFRGFRNAGGREELEFSYVVQFDDQRTGRLLWQEERRVVYSRAGSAGLFRFDAQQSEASQSYVEKVFAFDSMSTDDFVDVAYDRLLAIASQPRDARRDWLRYYLEKAAVNAKTDQLRKVLGGRAR